MKHLRTRTTLALSTLICAGWLSAACGGSPAGAAGPSSPGSPGTGSDDAASAATGEGGGESGGEPSGPRPPDFELETLDGDTFRLSDHLGKSVILIDFWATFCDPCLASMPHIDALYKKYKGDGFVVVGISIDGPNSVAQVRTEVSKLGVTFPILLDQESRVVSLYNPKTSAPYSVLIGRDGGVIKKKEGYTTGDASALENDITAALGK